MTLRDLMLLPILAFAACGGRFGDKQNNKTGLRIVSVSKQLTEIIFAVGGDTALVGVDISSTWPEAAKKITTVGYHRALSPEGIISLNPGVIWDDGNWGPPATIAQLKKVGIAMRQFNGGSTIDSTEMLIRTIAAEFRNPRAGDSLCARLDADMQRADSLRKTYAGQPPLKLPPHSPMSSLPPTMVSICRAAWRSSNSCRE